MPYDDAGRYTGVRVVANNGYSIMSLADDGAIHLKGFRKQSRYDWPA